MRLTSLKFRHVGPFGAQGVSLVDLSEGLNVVCQTNEFGKSTILKALETVLFKPFSSADKQVKALRHAASDEAPEGEITFASDGRSYRLTKRFLKKKGALLQDSVTGETLATDRAAEEKMAELMRADRFDSGPSGLLWVRQGKSMEGVKDDGQVASRLEGELGALIGGEKARDYLTRVESELAAYITKTGAAKKGGPLQMAQAAVAATQDELTEAVRLRDLTKDIGIELSRIESEILRLDAETSESDLIAQIHETRAEMTTARNFANALALLEAKRDQAKEKSDQAGARQQAEIEKLVIYNDVQKQLSQMDQTFTALTASIAQTRETRDQLRGEIGELETRMEALGQIRSKRETMARLKQRLEEIGRETARLSAVLEEVGELETELSRLTDSIADLPPVRRADVETLRRGEDDMRQVEAELSALSTRLFLELTPDGAGKVVVDGETLKSGAFELSGGAVVELAGIGRLRSDDGRLRELTSRRAALLSDQSDRLAQFGIETSAEAGRAADKRQTWEADRKRLTTTLSRLAPQGRAAIDTDLSAGAAEAETLSDKLNDLSADTEAGGDETDVVEQLRARRATLSVEQDKLERHQAELAKAELSLARLRERLAGLNLPEDDAVREAQADVLAKEKLTAETDARAAAAKVAELELQTPTQPLHMLVARLTRLENVTESSRQNMEALKTQAAGLKARRDAAFEGEDAKAKVELLRARLEQEQSDLERQTRDKDVRVLLRETLTETQSQLREAYSAPVAEELAPLLSMVIPGARAGLGDSLGVDTVHRGGKSEAITQLSGGTQEQFAILTRLAYARLLARGGASAPVILDDALVYADDARRDAMFDVLNHVSTGEAPIQILYLSCHKGATLRLGGNVIRPDAWIEGH